MLDRFQDLPVHVLIVHATVVILPLAAITALVAAVYPRFRAWAGPLPAIASVVSLILVPLSTTSGENFYDRIKKATGGEQELIEDHEHLAEKLIWFVIPFAILTIAGYVLHKRGGPKALVLAVSALTVIAAVAVGVDVALIGHAGSKATYSGSP